MLGIPKEQLDTLGVGEMVSLHWEDAYNNEETQIGWILKISGENIKKLVTPQPIELLIKHWTQEKVLIVTFLIKLFKNNGKLAFNSWVNPIATERSLEFFKKLASTDKLYFWIYNEQSEFDHHVFFDNTFKEVAKKILSAIEKLDPWTKDEASKAIEAIYKRECLWLTTWEQEARYN